MGLQRSREFEWFENLKNPGTKRMYKNAVRDFMRFTGIVRPEDFRIVTRASCWRRPRRKPSRPNATARSSQRCF
jgi:hypothetical protein